MWRNMSLSEKIPAMLPSLLSPKQELSWCSTIKSKAASIVVSFGKVKGRASFDDNKSETRSFGRTCKIVLSAEEESSLEKYLT